MVPVRVSSAASERVVVAAIEGGPANALDQVIVAELDAAVASLTTEQALVITGQPGFFTGGLDLAVLSPGDDAATDLLAAMGQLLLRVLRSPRPVVVAADGHAVAAGAMLLLASDYALVSDRDARIGFAEVPSGLVLPAAVVELIAARVNTAAVLRLSAHGELVDPAEAVASGLADAVVPVEALLERAVAKAFDLGSLPAAAYAATKRTVTRRLIDAMTAAMRT